ncbi:MAG: 2-hydroxychromene-2-carboxylate isomerase [Deltaproteobacteria bacterium]|nr:2-hydroxychromene-2-carboxylate isomerase [Deltaproteobacteria bacterium]
MARPIRFCFDYLSPYAYLASTQIRALGARHGCAVEPVPVLFAALLGANGTRGPAEIPRKRAYIFKDVLRLAHALGQPIDLPASHPFNPLLALRATTAVAEPDARWELVHALFRATWVEGLRVEEPEVVARIATAAGLDGAGLVAAASQPEVKARLRTSTDEALAAGTFGVPTMLVEAELFWGVDSLPHLERYLRGEDPVTQAAAARWEGLRPSATRAGA